MNRNILFVVCIMVTMLFAVPVVTSSFADDHGMKSMSPTSSTKAADVRVALNSLLREHVILATSATDAAIGGRNDEFQAAAAALDGNAADIANAIGSIYGKEAGEAFLPLWRRHIGFFVDYTTGVATKDKAKQEKAVNDLLQYTQDFAAFINSASPALPVDTVANLSKTHVLRLKAVVDAQAKGNQAEAYTAIRNAASHMQNIADPLAETIVVQFPDKFAMN
jgi:hypothetical protein